MSEDAILSEALTRLDAAERSAYLDLACAGDAELRARIEARIASQGAVEQGAQGSPSSEAEATRRTDAVVPSQGTAADKSGVDGSGSPGTDRESDLHATFSSEIGGSSNAPPSTERPLDVGTGSRIGPYKLLHKLGEGGMGVVFLAEQEEPVRRRVALKVIKPEQAVARFVAERQALALMDHPSIAKVLDAGSTASHLPYFVMELVQGVPITAYCDRFQLSPRERLALFIPVCQAVQHAHQKGIIHRDIKPSNVLVTVLDDKPLPKVIDFGVAKAINHRLTDQTIYTQFGTVIGTLEYMSPEQAEMAGLDIDTRSDIYSLGVLLYELLTGTTPLALERRKLKRPAYDEVLRRIREEEPPKPSTRLSDSGEALTEIAAQRKTEPSRLPRLVRGELDWIVMKALEKDRTRRYESASGFARDIQRYLDGDPVEACPPSASYRLKKFARKYARVLATLCAFALMLVVGTVVSVAWAIRAVNAERRADAEAADAKAINDYLRKDLFGEDETDQGPRDLHTNPNERGRASRLSLSLRFEDYLDRAGSRLEGRFDKQPRIEASLRQGIGTLYWRLGEDAKALPQLEKALEMNRRLVGENNSETFNVLNRLALVNQDLSKFDRAESLFKESIEGFKRTKGEDHRDTLAVTSNLAYLYQDWGKFSLARPLMTRVLDLQRRTLGPDDLETLESENNLAVLEREEGKLADADARLTKVHQALSNKLGPEHRKTAGCMINLALVKQDEGKLDEAETLFTQAVPILRTELGEKHPETLKALHNQASLFYARGKLDQAEPLYRSVMETGRAALGEKSEYVLRPKHGLAHTIHIRGQLAEALPLFRELLDDYKQLQGPKGPMTTELTMDMALTLQGLGKHAESEPYFITSVDLKREAFGKDSIDAVLLEAQLGYCLLLQQKWVQAEDHLRAALAVRQAKTPNEWRTFSTRMWLGEALSGQKKFDEAEPLLVSGYEGVKAREDTIPPVLRKRVDQAGLKLIAFYEAWNKPAKAEEWRAKLKVPSAGREVSK